MRLSHTLFAVVAIAALAAAFAAGCKEKPATTQPATEIAQKVCPVTGDKIDPNIHVDYNGRRVYFCCQMCVATFEKDPAKYLAKVDEQIKSGAMPSEGGAMPSEGGAMPSEGGGMKMPMPEHTGG